MNAKSTLPMPGEELWIDARLRCCEAMEQARVRGVEQVTPESPVWWNRFKQGVFIGYGLPPIEVCPWCGANVLRLVREALADQEAKAKEKENA